MTEAEILTLKQTASEKTGVPVNLISGETAEEIAASAFALAKFRNEYSEKTDAEKRAEYENTPTRDKFATWFNGEPLTDPAAPIDNNKYPNVPDAGEVNLGDQRSTTEKFGEWFLGVSAFDPRKTRGRRSGGGGAFGYCRCRRC